MDYPTLKSIIEGLLFLAGEEGLTVKQMADIMEQRPELITDCLADMNNDMHKQGRGLQILKLAGKYKLATLPEHAAYFERLAYSPTRVSLSQAALETLAIIAYRQPITRIDIEEIRGVKADRAIHTLVSKELIKETGRAEAIGRPILYGTTQAFMDYFGLGSLAELPQPELFEDTEHLAEETHLLFSKLDEQQQLLIDDIEYKEK